LKMRIGIHSGYCAVGNFGSEHRMDYTAVGGTVNIASRLEGYAEPNAILLSKTTAMLVGDAIDIEPLELAQLKGILRPIDIYRVVGERRGPRFKDLKEEVPGLSIEMTSSEVDLAAARALLEHCLCLLIQQEEVKQDNEPVVRLLR
jgi:adenylate cyclase